jgi:hypothetical protein
MAFKIALFHAAALDGSDERPPGEGNRLAALATFLEHSPEGEKRQRAAKPADDEVALDTVVKRQSNDSGLGHAAAPAESRTQTPTSAGSRGPLASPDRDGRLQLDEP